MLKITLLFKKFTNFTGNNSRILKIKNTKFSGYCFNMNTRIQRDFKICINVPLILGIILPHLVYETFFIILTSLGSPYKTGVPITLKDEWVTHIMVFLFLVQNQSSTGALQNSCSQDSCKVHRKTPETEFYFWLICTLAL